MYKSDIMFENHAIYVDDNISEEDELKILIGRKQGSDNKFFIVSEKIHYSLISSDRDRKIEDILYGR